MKGLQPQVTLPLCTLSAKRVAPCRTAAQRMSHIHKHVESHQTCKPCRQGPFPCPEILDVPSVNLNLKIQSITMHAVGIEGAGHFMLCLYRVTLQSRSNTSVKQIGAQSNKLLNAEL